MFNNTQRYVLKVLMFLTSHCDEEEFFTLDEVSDGTLVPRGYMGEIAKEMSSDGLIKSKSGVGGGIQLDIDPGEWPMTDVMEYLEIFDHTVEPGDRECCVPPEFNQCALELIETKLDQDLFKQRTLDEFVDELTTKS